MGEKKEGKQEGRKEPARYFSEPTRIAPQRGMNHMHTQKYSVT